jgi:nicotinamidase-related amidase
MKPALFVIDLQKAFYKGCARDSMDRACGCINPALQLFRSHKLPIVWVQHMDKADGLVPGVPDFGFVEALTVGQGESVIVKEYGNAFNRTGCASLLAELGVDTVILSGSCAEHCVLSTYRGAKDLDLTPILLSGALASDEEANIGFVERISEAVGLGALRKFLENC